MAIKSKASTSYSQKQPGIVYVTTNETPLATLRRENAYNSSPTAMSENGIKIWSCGGTAEGPYNGHDSIYYTHLDENNKVVEQTQRVLTSMLNDTSEDGDHACAVSVIKQRVPIIENGKEKYKMYYECAPRMYRDSDNLTQGCYTQICHAVSDDGIHWQKYNEGLFASQYRYGFEDTEPTAVLKIGSIYPADKQVVGSTSITLGGTILNNIGFKIENGKRYAHFGEGTGCNDLGLNYGVGHPSAIALPVQPDGVQWIWMWYYDSQGSWNDRAMYLAKSWDGIHFERPVKTTLQSPTKIKYVNIPMLGHKGFFIATGSPFSMNIYNYSWDGINWFWGDQGDVNFYKVYLKSLLNMSPNITCTVGSGTIVSDSFGNINSPAVTFISNQGYFGKTDSCTATNGCTCYDKREDVSRGSTWMFNIYSGKIFENPSVTMVITPTIKPTITIIPSVKSIPSPTGIRSITTIPLPKVTITPTAIPIKITGIINKSITVAPKPKIIITPTTIPVKYRFIRSTGGKIIVQPYNQ